MKKSEFNKEEPNEAPIQNINQRTFKDKILAFLKNNKAATTLSILLLIAIIWFFVKLRTNERNFNNEKSKIITRYENTIDSLQIKNLEFATEVFSWSVRSELLRNNTENLNQLLTLFAKKSSADLIQIINPENKNVLLSSDKKFEGVRYSGLLDFEIKNTVVLKDESAVKIITPVMGFNSMIGILIVEIEND